MSQCLIEHVRAVIRDVPHFPKPGIVFKDITPLLGDPVLLRQVLALMANPFRDQAVTHVLAIESRGFLFGTPVAMELNSALVPARKPGKLPWTTVRVDYALEYGVDSLEIHADAINAGHNVLVVDDVLATGGTAEAAMTLIRQVGATPIGLSVLVELEFLGGRRRLGGLPVHHVVSY